MLRQGTMILALVGSAGLAQTEQLQPITPKPDSAVVRPSQAISETAIEVVFVLDTTGSMSGLIEGAKQKIWSIANQIATARPRPTIRMGLVGYRDRGDEYVTTSTALTEDLDAIYSDLMGYVAAGGGDGPESVNQALHEAVSTFEWTPRESETDTLRIIYLVGDAPPHMDYEQDVKYHASCEAASSRGIIINTIQCGTATDTMPIWREIARLAEGEYFAIEQSGGVVALETPYDAELERLSVDLGGTLLAYGTPEQQEMLGARRERSRRILEEADAPAAAERALYLAKDEDGSTLAGERELVQALQSGAVRLNEIPVDELPEELRDLNEDERNEFVAAKTAERARIQAEIQAIAVKRDEFIRAELERLGGTRDSFDEKVLEALRSQAGKVGISFE